MKARQQSGFTLIELVMVIVILGILSAVAIPQFVDLTSDARQGAVDGVAGALGSANVINFSACKISGSAACKTVADCDDSWTLIQGGQVTGYTITGAVDADGESCTVTSNDDATATATFVGYAAAP